MNQVLISAGQPVTDSPTLLDGKRTAQQRKIGVLLSEVGVQESMLGKPCLLKYRSMYIATYIANQIIHIPRGYFILFIFKSFHYVHM